MLHAFISLLLVLSVCFWLVQLVDLLLRDPDYFESHTHKLIWFIVLWISFILGAVWYYIWKRQAIKEFESRKYGVERSISKR